MLVKKKSLDMVPLIICFLFLMYPLAKQLAAHCGYKLEFYTPLLIYAVPVLFEVVGLVLLLVKKSILCKPGKVFAAALLPIVMISGNSYIMSLEGKGAGKVSFAIALWIISVGFGVWWLFKYAANKFVKIPVIIWSGIIGAILGVWFFLLLLTEDFGVYEVIQKIESPSGKYYAELINDDQGAMGGSTIVEVSSKKECVPFLIGELVKNQEISRIYTGRWGEFKTMEIFWLDEDIILINGEEYRRNESVAYGTFTKNDVYSYDERFLAKQKTESVKVNGENLRQAVIEITDTQSGKVIYEITPARTMDFWGICWESDSYNFWIQSGDTGVHCYCYRNGTWERDNSAVRPWDIISKYDDRKRVTPAVRESANEVAESFLTLYNEACPDCEYSDYRLEALWHVYTYEEFQGKKLHVYCLNFELLAGAPENVILAGGAEMTKDGWVVPDYPNSRYLIFEEKDGEMTYLTFLFENDCYPGDELFNSDLEQVLISAEYKCMY